jgi:hypothetical protein
MCPGMKHNFSSGSKLISKKFLPNLYMVIMDTGDVHVTFWKRWDTFRNNISM